MLQADPTLADVTHLCVDEVHERDVLADFLLVIVRDLLARRCVRTRTFERCFNRIGEIKTDTWPNGVRQVGPEASADVRHSLR